MIAVEVAPENPYAGQGSVLLDIGGDIGALVVTMPTTTVGDEVEILQSGEAGRDGHSHRPHVAVVNRPVGGSEVPSLVFPELVGGRYNLVPKGTDDVRLSVEVRGGEVTYADWRA